MIVSKQTLALIRLAVNPAASEEEARTVAVQACKALVKEGILGDASVIPEAEPVEEGPAETGSYSGTAPPGEVRFHDMGATFDAMGRAAASAKSAAESEDRKKACTCDYNDGTHNPWCPARTEIPQ